MKQCDERAQPKARRGAYSTLPCRRACGDPPSEKKVVSVLELIGGESFVAVRGRDGVPRLPVDPALDEPDRSVRCRCEPSYFSCDLAEAAGDPGSVALLEPTSAFPHLLQSRWTRMKWSVNEEWLMTLLTAGMWQAMQPLVGFTGHGVGRLVSARLARRG